MDKKQAAIGLCFGLFLLALGMWGFTIFEKNFLGLKVDFVIPINYRGPLLITEDPVKGQDLRRGALIFSSEGKASVESFERMDGLHRLSCEDKAGNIIPGEWTSTTGGDRAIRGGIRGKSERVGNYKLYFVGTKAEADAYLFSETGDYYRQSFDKR